MKYRNLETKVEQRAYLLTISSVANGVQTLRMGRDKQTIRHAANVRKTV